MVAEHEESEVMDGEDDDDEDDDDEDDDDDYDTKVWELFSLMRNIISRPFPTSEYVLTFLFPLWNRRKGTAGGEGQQGKRPIECKQQ